MQSRLKNQLRGVAPGTTTQDVQKRRENTKYAFFRQHLHSFPHLLSGHSFLLINWAAKPFFLCSYEGEGGESRILFRKCIVTIALSGHLRMVGLLSWLTPTINSTE